MSVISPIKTAVAYGSAKPQVVKAGTRIVVYGTDKSKVYQKDEAYNVSSLLARKLVRSGKATLNKPQVSPKESYVDPVDAQLQAQAVADAEAKAELEKQEKAKAEADATAELQAMEASMKQDATLGQIPTPATSGFPTAPIV